MNIERRVKRRIRRQGQRKLIEEHQYLSPMYHVSDPVGRGPVVEQVLDHLNPVFDGKLPPNGYLYGPSGTGKSAIISVVFENLKRALTHVDNTIPTSTRSPSPVLPAFIYIDTRWSESEFAFYHSILDRLVDEKVPQHGVSTEEITERLHSVLAGPHTGVVIAVDHVDELDRTDGSSLIELFRGLPANVSWIAVGRNDPSEIPLTQYTSGSIRVDRYRGETLVDLLMSRASKALSTQALEYSLSEFIAQWADGNAHDALTVLLGATVEADRTGKSRVSRAEVESAMEGYPRPAVSLGRVFALPENWQAVLRELIDCAEEDLHSISATTTALETSSRFDLSEGTIKRILYEMADKGVLERVQNNRANGTGRPSSRIDPQFPTAAFRWLYDREHSENRL